MRLTDRIALVGSGDSGGFSLTAPFDCHVFLIDGGEELALVDSGSGQSCEAILEQVSLAGYQIERIRSLLLTHAHMDHSGGAKALRDRLRLKVVASSRTARLLESGDAEGIGLGPAQRAGLYPDHFHFEACPVDIVTDDDHTLAIGDLNVKVIATPGHSADHVAYLLEGRLPALFSGDSVFAGGKIILQNLPDCVLQDYVDTIRRLDELEVEILLPSHGLIALNRGHQHLAAARFCVDRLQIPAHLSLV